MCDRTVNQYGRKLNTIIKDLNLFVANGRVPGDMLGNFTCFTARGRSVVDLVDLYSPIYAEDHLVIRSISLHKVVKVVLRGLAQAFGRSVISVNPETTEGITYHSLPGPFLE